MLSNTPIPIPPTAEIRASLGALTHAQLRVLTRVSGVPFTTIYKVRDGTTANPGVETVRKFWPYVVTLMSDPEREARAA